MASTQEHQAEIYRMVMPGHTCPYGLKAKDLLRRSGFRVEDHPLTSRPMTDQFKAEHGVSTTPQVFIDGERIGGYDDLRRHLGRPIADSNTPSYRPVVAVFGVAALMAVAVNFYAYGAVVPVTAAGWFVAFSMCILAMLKLQDLERFSSMFLNYDLLARRWVPYSYIYPFAELAAGVLMAAHALAWLSIPLALVIGSIGATSVFKAVYIDRRSLKCACVGGSGQVPLGFVSLAENLMMVAMALVMAWAAMR
ncbi:MAG TPA: MauE/DoxX family redox-associated membrane protein [Steroidobacteraceae bacterium]|jgi:glutaredoxin|nr:MauE/DoxX family redox-associated membrane protein [Steroidobacteraceae bacterium]